MKLFNEQAYGLDCYDEICRVIDAEVSGHWYISHRAISSCELWSVVADRCKCDIDEIVFDKAIAGLCRCGKIDITTDGCIYPHGKELKTGPLPAPDEIEPKPKDTIN